MQLEKLGSPERIDIPNNTIVKLRIDSLVYTCQVLDESKLHLIKLNGDSVSGPPIIVGSREDGGELVDGLVREGKNLMFRTEGERSSLLGEVSLFEIQRKPDTQARRPI